LFNLVVRPGLFCGAAFAFGRLSVDVNLQIGEILRFELSTTVGTLSPIDSRSPLWGSAIREIADPALLELGQLGISGGQRPDNCLDLQSSQLISNAFLGFAAKS